MAMARFFAQDSGGVCLSFSDVRGRLKRSITQVRVF
jgi:hypothetical protein